jgi:hypothetical protein
MDPARVGLWSASFAGAERMFLLRPPPAVQGPSGPNPGPGGHRSRGWARGLAALHPGPNATGWCPTGRSRTPLRASPMAWTFIRASHEGTACILTGPAALTDDVRRRTGRSPRTSGAASHRGRSLSGWPHRRGPTAPKRPAAGAVPGVACPGTGPEVAFKQGHSTLLPTRASPDNEPGIG